MSDDLDLRPVRHFDRAAVVLTLFIPALGQAVLGGALTTADALATALTTADALATALTTADALATADYELDRIFAGPARRAARSSRR